MHLIQVLKQCLTGLAFQRFLILSSNMYMYLRVTYIVANTVIRWHVAKCFDQVPNVNVDTRMEYFHRFHGIKNFKLYSGGSFLMPIVSQMLMLALVIMPN